MSETFSPIVVDTKDFQLFDDINRKYFSTSLNYGWKSNTEKKEDYGHWNRELLTNSLHFPYDHAYMPMMARHKSILPIWEIIKSKIPKNRGIYRMYINGYTYGTDAYAHRDEIHLLENDSFAETVVYYLNRSWHHDWAGETVLFDEDCDITKSVLPKAGRMLIFSSNTLHAARPVSRACPVLRLILAIKTFNTNFSSKEIEFLLDKTTGISHSGKTFFEHLFNTSVNLQKIDQSKEVCAAGLFHSIYGTEYFKVDEQTPREAVKKLIGEYAESLAYEFCTLKNRYDVLANDSNLYQPKFRKDLLSIEYANLIDQNYDGRYSNQISNIKEIIDSIK